jgi:hypothetical protein
LGGLFVSIGRLLLDVLRFSLPGLTDLPRRLL